MFGQSASGNTFGQPTAFGSSTTTPFGSMNAQPQQGSLFGQTSTPSLFGMSQPNSIFGAASTNQPTNTFGSQQPTSTFGSSSLFGNATQPQTNSLFGNTNRSFGMSTGTTGFQGTLSQPMNVPAGTTVKFVAQTGTDTMMKNGHSQSTSINIRLQCITCMREYESKSLEELRLEDYNANRKGQQQQQGTLFGSSNISNSGGLFGQTNTNPTNAFGSSASTGNLFTQNKSSFGSIAPTTTTTTSFFGSNANKTSFFSTPNTGTPFQTQAQPSLFGNNAPAAQPLGTSSFFGSSNLNTNPTIDPSKSLFGQPTSQPSSIFGSSTTQNIAATKPTFGNTTTPFGTQPQTGGLFGSSTNTNTGNFFGATSQPSLFNTNTSTNTGIGNKPFFNLSSSAPSFNTGQLSTTTSAPTNLFGNSTFGQTGGSNMFGSNLNSNTFNTFNTSSQPFQSSNPSLQFNSSNAFGSTNNNLSSGSFMNQAQTGLANPVSPVNTDQIIARLQTLPYGSPQLLTDSSFSSSSAKTKFTTDPKTLNQYKINAKSQAEVKVQRVPATGKPTTLLFDGLDDESSDNLKCAKDIFSPRPNIKKLVLNKGNTSLFKSSFIKSSPANETEIVFSNKENRSPESNSSMSKQVLDNTIDVINKLTNEAKDLDSSLNVTDKSLTGDNLNSTCEENVANSFIPKCGIILTRTDYYTIPSIEECDAFYSAESDSCIVESFTVGRVDYGSIYWKGPLNVKGINLDEIVHIRRKEVIVYPDDDAKPPVGDGLNKAAQITLDQVWPIDKTSREFIKDPQRLRAMKYSEQVEAATIKLDAIFKEYRPDTGSWVFTVKHFSKYGLDVDDEDVEMDTNKANSNELKNSNLDKKDSLKLNGESLAQFSINSSPDLLAKDQMLQMNAEMNEMYSNGYPLDAAKNSSLNVSSYYNYDSLFNEDEMAEEQSNQMKTKNELNLMRSALFVDQDEAYRIDTVTKKCKNLSFTKSATSHQVIPSLFPSKIKTAITKRRKLQFETTASKNKANILSLGHSPCPKVSFSNGSNRFCLVHEGQVIIFDVDLLNLEKNTAIEKLEDHLSNNSSLLAPTNSHCPPLIKSNKFGLNVGAETNLNALIEALYGELSETLNYSRYQERLRRIECWLFNYNKTLPVPEKPVSRIIHFLTTNELEFAVTECINSKQHRLSYLIAAGPFNSKTAILAQLDQWKRSEADVHIDTDLLKLYVLLSGQSTWALSNNEIVDVFETLQWTQQLILNLLYKDHQMNDSEIIGTNLVKLAIAQLVTKPNVVEYHLLAQSQPWVAIASCPKLLDSWFLHESLSSYNVIIDDLFTNKSDSIHLFLASQAKDLRYALFFVLHIQNEFLRYNCTRELLVRDSLQLINSEVEKFLKEKLSINQRLISEAKLYYWKSRFNFKTTAFNLIDCGQFNEAHDILTEQVFPELVINEDYNEIMHLIRGLADNKQLISSWNINGAGVYEIFNELLHFNSKSDLAKYKHLVENFNAHQLRCPTKRHRLCQSQMTRVANIIHAQLNDGMFAYNTPVPDDYTLLELRSNAYKILEAELN